MMKSSDAIREFGLLLGGRAGDLSSVTPDAGVRAMLSFYRASRVEDCALAQGGDMLLYQWGTHDWGVGPRFELDITRQFILGAGDDEDIWQLSLTFAFSPSRRLAEVGQGNRWCETPDEVPDFESFINGSPAFQAVMGRNAVAVELDYECAG